MCSLSLKQRHDQCFITNLLSLITQTIILLMVSHNNVHSLRQTHKNDLFRGKYTIQHSFNMKQINTWHNARVHSTNTRLLKHTAFKSHLQWSGCERVRMKSGSTSDQDQLYVSYTLQHTKSPSLYFTHTSEQVHTHEKCIWMCAQYVCAYSLSVCAHTVCVYECVH